MRTLIYLDDVLQTEGSIELRTRMRAIPVSPDDPDFDPELPTKDISYETCIVNGRPARAVGPAVINPKRDTVIWRFKTIS